MAFIEQQSKSKKEMIMTVALTVLVIASGFVWYFGFIREPSSEKVADDTSFTKEEIALLDVEATETTLKEVSKSIGFINDTFFSSLKMYGEDIRRAATPDRPAPPPPTKGRSNPFLPY